jgi:hypothetical protein
MGYLVGWGGGSLVEFSIVIVLAIIALLLFVGWPFALATWAYVHDKLREEKREDAAR